MLLSKFIKRVNKLVGNSSSFALTYNQLEQYISTAVHTINLDLKTTMPTPEEDWESHTHLYSIIYSKNFLGSMNYISSDYTPKEGEMYYNLQDETYYIYLDNTWQEIFINEYDTGQLIPKLNISDSLYEYRCMPDYLIDTVLIYLTAAFYLEEEDELEKQYNEYLDKATRNLSNIQSTYYSSYNIGPTCNFKPDYHNYDTNEDSNDNNNEDSPVDLSNYYTKPQVDSKIQNIQNNYNNLENRVNSLENNPGTPGTNVNLSNYYTKSEIDAKGYLTQHQDISHLASKSYVEQLVGNIETILSSLVEVDK